MNLILNLGIVYSSNILSLFHKPYFYQQKIIHFIVKMIICIASCFWFLIHGISVNIYSYVSSICLCLPIGYIPTSKASWSVKKCTLCSNRHPWAISKAVLLTCDVPKPFLLIHECLPLGIKLLRLHYDNFTLGCFISSVRVGRNLCCQDILFSNLDQVVCGAFSVAYELVSIYKFFSIVVQDSQKLLAFPITYHNIVFSQTHGNRLIF